MADNTTETSAAAYFNEVGSTGVPNWNGRYADRYLEVLQGPGGIQQMAKILRTESSAYTPHNAVLLTAKQAVWKGAGASDKPADRRAAEFLDQCIDDMSKSWSTVVQFALSGLPFGFSDLYVVLKRRLGRNPPGELPVSKFNDQLIGLRKLAIRRQETIDHWETDDNGDPKAMIQIDPITGKFFDPVPIDRLLHFRFGDDRGSWEGLGWLELAYKPYHMIQNLEIIYGIGQQRSHVGLPVFGYKSKPDADTRNTVNKMGRQLVVNEQQFVTYPQDVVDFRLDTVTNTNASETRMMIQQLRWEIMSLMLAQFLRLGSTETGAKAVADPMLDLFRDFVNAANMEVANIMNDHLVPRLMRVNPSIAGGLTDYPKLIPSPVKSLPVAVLTFLDSISRFLSTAGQEDSDWMRSLVQMPLIKVDEAQRQATIDAQNNPPDPNNPNNQDGNNQDAQNNQDAGNKDNNGVAKTDNSQQGDPGTDKQPAKARGIVYSPADHARMQRLASDFQRTAETLAALAPQL